MQHKTQTQKRPINQPSHLLIISHDKEEFEILSDILQHYFPHDKEQQNVNQKDIKNDNDKLLIKNKYYKAEVKISNMLWQQTQLWRYNAIVEEQGQQNKKQQRSQQQQQNQPKQIEQPKTYDLMIMLVTQTHQQTIDLSSLDLLIQTINPQQFVLLINTQNVQNQLKYQEVILDKCNNFIEIVKEDLLKVRNNKPVWSRGALLNCDDEENMETGVFSVLDRMETTRWSNMVDVKKEEKNKKNNQNVDNKKDQQKYIKEEDKIVGQERQTKEKVKSEQNSTTIQQKKQINYSSSDQQQQQQQHQISSLLEQHNNKSKKQQHKQQQQVDQQKLQSQMQIFQQMMSQMMSFKMQSQQMNNNQRKHQAQILFSKMFANIIDQQQ